MKLEKIEIGGLRGRLLSSRVVAVFAEFSEHLALFGSKTYDALDPEDLAFETDYQDFQRKIRDLDRRLAFVLCQAFDDCCNLESVFKLIEIVGSVLDRPIIKDEFTGKYDAILGMLNAELVTAEALYEDQMASLTKHGWMPVDKNMPPVAGALRWAYQLRQRVTVPVRNFKALQHPIVTCPEAAVVLAKYDCMMDLLNKFENEMFTSWAASVPDQCEKNLKLSLLTRKAVNNELALNFHPELTAILREVHYLNLVEHTDIPEEAIHIYERSETFRKYTSNLNQTIQWYNKVLRLSRPVEFALVEEKVQEIDALVEQGQSSLNWNSMDLWDYIERLHQLVHSLEARVQQTQDNIERIRNIMSVWSKVALFERSDGRKDTLLCIGDQSEHVQRRYSEISAAAIEIHSLVQQNLELFGMQQAVDSSHWLDYVGYVDNIIYKSLLRTIGCSLGYLAENMDQNNGLAPLFEAQLALCEPELVFIPSLDPAAPGCFASVVEGLINDIVKMASLIPCIALSHETASYEVDMENNEDIREMKREILDSVQSVMQEANEFSHSFETYSYLWLDDRECYMQQFLTYGRQLTADELELIALDDGMAPKPNPPNMELFREQNKTHKQGH